MTDRFPERFKNAVADWSASQTTAFLRESVAIAAEEAEGVGNPALLTRGQTLLAPLLVSARSTITEAITEAWLILLDVAPAAFRRAIRAVIDEVSGLCGRQLLTLVELLTRIAYPERAGTAYRIVEVLAQQPTSDPILVEQIAEQLTYVVANDEQGGFGPLLFVGRLKSVGLPHRLATEAAARQAASYDPAFLYVALSLYPAAQHRPPREEEAELSEFIAELVARSSPLAVITAFVMNNPRHMPDLVRAAFSPDSDTAPLRVFRDPGSVGDVILLERDQTLSITNIAESCLAREDARRGRKPCSMPSVPTCPVVLPFALIGRTSAPIHQTSSEHASLLRPTRYTHQYTRKVCLWPKAYDHDSTPGHGYPILP